MINTGLRGSKWIIHNVRYVSFGLKRKNTLKYSKINGYRLEKLVKIEKVKNIVMKVIKKQYAK